MPSTLHVEADLGAKAAPASTAARRDLVIALSVGLAIIFAHRSALASMVQLWNASPMYSYGFTVPLISGYLLWSRRDALSRLEKKPSYVVGALLLGMAALLTAAARAGGIQVLEQTGFLLSLAGAGALIFGLAHMRVAWAALAYLLLMVPLWDGLTERLHEPFQMRSAAIGGWLLQAIGVPAFRHGLTIELPKLTIEVARACSGVNYLIAVLALGLPLSYLHLQSTWRRTALLMSALVVAALSNGLRVALIGLLAYLEIGSPLHGPFHMLHGLFVAAIGYVVLFAGLRVLASTSPAKSVEARTPAPREGEPFRQVSARAAGMLVAGFLLLGSTPPRAVSPTSPPDAELSLLPERLGDWSLAREVPASEAGPGFWPGADVEVSQEYRRDDGVAVFVYIAYFAAQGQGKEMVTHNVTELHNRATLTCVPDGTGRCFNVNAVATLRESRPMLFWYDLGHGPSTGRVAVKLLTLWDTMWKGRSRGAVVALTGPKADLSNTADASEAEALNNLASLVQAAVAVSLDDRSGSKSRE